MRISDWSSDVCSSDLNLPPLPFTLADILKHPGIKHPHPPLFERDHARFLPALELAVDMLAAHAREIAEFGLAQFDALRRLEILADQPFQIARQPRTRRVGAVALDRLIGRAQPPCELLHQRPGEFGVARGEILERIERSEEHTAALQSL